jgi:hypothetical protein
MNRTMKASRSSAAIWSDVSIAAMSRSPGWHYRTLFAFASAKPARCLSEECAVEV